MGTREVDPRLKKLYDEKKNIYSVSKINTINGCLYEAWCTYKQHYKGKNGIYGILGGKIHDKLEKIINNQASEVELPSTLEEELSDLAMLDIDFPRDFKGGTSIRDNWIADMTNFCHSFVKPKGEFTTEEFVLYKINDDRYVQGYIDLIKHNNDGTISIYDWKTSTNFTKNDLIHHGHQLVFYALAKEQEGETVKEVAWIMLKYCEVQFEGKARKNSKNTTQLVKVCNRGKLVQELKPYLETDLEELGYDEVDIEVMLNNALQSNTLPQVLKDKYKIKPYVRKYEITDELKQETLDYINSMADIFENTGEDENNWTPRSFVTITKTGKENDDSFYCRTLCNHRETCPHIKKYNDLRALTKMDDEDLF